MSPTALSCLACHSPAEHGDRFCETCGSDVPSLAPTVSMGGAGPLNPATRCSACGHDLDRVADGYCGRCGTRQPEPRDLRANSVGPVAAVSDRGQVRPRNEDAFAISVTPDGRVVAVVCDGVSTTAHSEVAAQAAADAAVAALLETHDPGPWEDLDAAYEAARIAVQQVPWSPEEEAHGPPSCTFLAAVVAGGDVRVSSLGDCRAVWLPGAGEARTLTEDDSWAAEQVAAGTMSADVAHLDPRAHGITRWLARDADPTWLPRRAGLSGAGPGQLVLCSDGLWNYAWQASEVAAAAPSGDASAVAAALVDWANRQGGHDNITVAVLDVGVPGGVGRADKKGNLR